MLFMKDKMLIYLQEMLDKFMAEKEMYGADDRMVEKDFDDMIACKEMVEALIEEPVNLQLDGKVTIGL